MISNAVRAARLRARLWVPLRVHLSSSSSNSAQAQLPQFPHDLGRTYLVDPPLSHVRGGSEPALLERTVDEQLLHTVAQHGSRQAVVVTDGASVLARLTYDELNEKVDDLARGLARLGVARGDRVGVWMPNSEAWVLSQYALARLGAVLVCVNPAYRQRELVHALNLVELKALIMAPAVAANDFVATMRALLPHLARPGRDPYAPLASEPCHAQSALPHLQYVVLADGAAAAAAAAADGNAAAAAAGDAELFVPFEALLQRDGPSAASSRVRPEDTINIQFTSGTTGRPKGACLSSRSIVNNGRLAAECMQLTFADVVNVCPPLYHCFGLCLGNLAALHVGASVVYPARVFSAAKTLAAVESERCTALYGVPAMFSAELALQDAADAAGEARTDVSSLRTGIAAGSAVPKLLMGRLMHDLNLHDLVIGYGQTETGPLSFMSRTADPPQARCETVGRVLPHTECKVLSAAPEHAELAPARRPVVPVGQPGELFTRGYGVMNGYFNDAARTAEALSEGGWMRTGDLVCMDADGSLRVVGRIKDVVIRGGENLFPREVEEVVAEVDGVQEVHVVGVPGGPLGEELCAVVVLAPGAAVDAEKVRAYVKGQLSHQKVPKFVLFLEEMGDFQTVTGKIQKFKLREWAADELGMPLGEA